MTETIPPDVMEAARKVAREVRNAAHYDDRSDYPGIDWDEDSAVWDIAQAILAERERCANIAESNDAFPFEGAHIAQAIRGEGNGKAE